jgi:methionyl-tRNA formyltransferase
VLDVLSDLEARRANGRPQPAEGVTPAPKLDPSMGLLRWSDAAVDGGRSSGLVTVDRVCRMARAFDDSFGVFTFFAFGKPAGTLKRVRLLDVASVPPGDAQAQGLPEAAPPGALHYSKPRRQLSLRCSDGWVAVKQLHVAFKKPATGVDFANGFHVTESSGHAFVQPVAKEEAVDGAAAAAEGTAHG